jgi:hypothetical protein
MVAGSLLAAAIFMGASAGGAAAAPNPGPGTGGGSGDGPQSANVPTLAWVGEEVQLVACDPAIDATSRSQTQEADWSVENWTGDQAYQATPTFDGSQTTNETNYNNPGTDTFFTPSESAHSGDGCVSADIKSLHAGLTQIKLDVSTNSDPGTTHDSGDVYAEQFIVIWMTANAPTLTEASVSTQATDINSLSNPGTPGTDAPPTAFSQLTPNGVKAATAFLGDPSGNSLFNPDALPYTSSSNLNTNNGLIDIRVTGSFPVEDAEDQAFLGADSFTLPSQWATLADKLATSSIYNTGITPNLWDIHGGPTNGTGATATSYGAKHTGSSSGYCSPDTTAAFLQLTDSVDNCQGGNTAFSRVFGDVTSGGTATVGPYDPEAANETLISDGILNSDDAPMPALPVSVSIAGNKGGTDIGGVGGLYGVSKQLIYSHDFNGATNAGNLYNPYYSEYIPSTARPINEASGITGVAGGGDFPGIGSNGVYTFWTALDSTSADAASGPTKCLDHTGLALLKGGKGQYDNNNYNEYDTDSSSLNALPADYYQSPHYPTSLTVYTDERGEAYVQYNPGNGFYFNDLINAGLISVDNNNACDLQALNGKPIGDSVISAQTEAPYQTVPYTWPAGTNAITKTVVSQWSKTLTSYPKNDVSGVPASIFVAKATDIDGNPIAGEIVCFGASPSSNVSDYLGTDAQVTEGGVVVANLDGSTSVPISGLPGASGSVCDTTNSLGEAAAEVVNSNPAVDVTAEFYNEGIFRDVNGTLGVTQTTVSSSPSDSTNSGSSNGGSNGGGGSSSSNGGGSKVSTGSGVTQYIVSWSLIRSKGSYYVRGKFHSSHKTVTITIKVYNKHGKLTHEFKATVAANKQVLVKLKGVTKNHGQVTVKI